MPEIIRQSKPRARKNYHCEGREQMQNCGDDINEVEKQINLCKGIKKGDIYEYQFNKDGGDVWTWRSCLGCFNLIKKHSLHDF